MKKKDDPTAVLFRKKSLLDQVVETLRDSIQRGLWKNYLPTERLLCRSIEVSRPLLRKALHVLAEEGLVKIASRHPTKIIRQPSNRRKPPLKRVLLVYGEPFFTTEHMSMVIVDEIRKRLYGRNYSFDMLADLRMQRKNPVPFLKGLVQQHEADCWILAGVPRWVQEWFQTQHLHAVVMGSAFPQVSLPSADYDHRATARHAVGTFLSLGHRRIVCLMRETAMAGDLELANGFTEAFRKRSDVTSRLIWHSGEKESVRSRLRTAMFEKERPTAILVSHSLDSLVALTSLVEWGFHVPRDVSFISNPPATYLSRLTPTPATYGIDPFKLARAICLLIEKPTYAGGRLRLVPPLVQGESVGPAPGGKTPVSGGK